MVMPGGRRKTRGARCECAVAGSGRACEQLGLKSVGRDDERLWQQLLLESIDKLGRAVALAVVAQHGVANVSQPGIVCPRAL
jgi:hypothetical protein